MRIIKYLILRIFLFGLILCSHSSTIASDPLLKEIRFKKVSDSEERVLFTLNGFYPPEVLALKGEKPRVVCDFLNTRFENTSNRSMETNGNFIQEIRVGIYTSPQRKTRVVLDLAPNQNYDIQQVFFQKENIFLISVSPANIGLKK